MPGYDEVWRTAAGEEIRIVDLSPCHLLDIERFLREDDWTLPSGERWSGQNLELARSAIAAEIDRRGLPHPLDPGH